MTKLKLLLYSLFFYSLAGFGISLTIKASVGVSGFNSFNVAMSEAFHIKVGTITMFSNFFFLLFYMVLTKFKTPSKYFIQGLSVFCFGYVINAFTYYLIPSTLPSSYLLQISLFIGGTIIAGLSTGVVLYLDVITFPMEGFCLTVSKLTNHPFALYRYLIDLICVMLSFILSFTFQLPLFVREGTLISIVLLSFCIQLSKSFCQRLQEKKKVSVQH